MVAEPSMNDFEIVRLKSGINSLRCRVRKETFHPGVGPQVEARILHVEQQRLVERCASATKFVIWDIGLGAAANVLTAIEVLALSHAIIEIHSFDRTTAPLEFALLHAQELGYIVEHEKNLRLLLREKQVVLNSKMTWTFHFGDFGETIKTKVLPSPNAIFYDPYSPTGNPEMWTLENFCELYKRLDPLVPCSLTNYTRSTAVRAALLLAGFFVGTGTPIGDKSETTVAANHMDLLEHPLDCRWLERVRLSSNSAPLRTPIYSMSVISDEDFERLKNLPQFSV